MIRQRTFAWTDHQRTAEASRGMAGLEVIRGFREGNIPPPPSASLIGFAEIQMDEGRVVMRLDPKEYPYSPNVTMHGGILATLLDSVMGCAVLPTA